MTRPQHWWLGISVVIVIIAIFLRFYHLGSIPQSLYWDEMAIYLDARSISETGVDMHGRPWFQILYPSYGDFKLPVYIWLSGVSFLLFGPSQWAVRLPSALAGVGTVVVVGWIGYKVAQKLWPLANNKKYAWQWWGLAVVSMGIMATSPWAVLFSRTGFEGHLAQFLVAISVAILVHNQRWWRWLVAGAVGAVATYAYFSVRFVWPVVVAGYWLWLLSGQLQGKKFSLASWWPVVRNSFIGLAAGGLVFGVVLLPMVRSPLYADTNRFRLATVSVLQMDEETLQSNVYREWAGNQPWDRIFFHRYWLVGRELLRNYADHLDLGYLFAYGDSNPRHGTTLQGLFVMPLAVVFILGWYRLAIKQPLLGAWWGMWWLAALLPASVPEGTPHALRSLNALVPLTLVMGVGIVHMLEWVEQATKSQRKWRASVVMVYLLVVAVATAQFWYTYTRIYPQLSGKDWQGGYQQLTSKILELHEGTPVYVITFDDRFYLWFMAFGLWSPVDWQQWISRDYKFQQLPGVEFQRLDEWPLTASNDSRVTIAGTREEVQKWLNRNPVIVVKSETLHAGGTSEVFQVVVVDRRLDATQ